MFGVGETFDERLTERLHFVEKLFDLVHSIDTNEIEAQVQAVKSVKKLAVHDADSSFRVPALLKHSIGQVVEVILTYAQTKSVNILVNHLRADLG